TPRPRGREQRVFDHPETREPEAVGQGVGHPHDTDVEGARADLRGDLVGGTGADVEPYIVKFPRERDEQPLDRAVAGAERHRERAALGVADVVEPTLEITHETRELGAGSARNAGPLRPRLEQSDTERAFELADLPRQL